MEADGLEADAAALLFARSDAGSAAAQEIAHIERMCRDFGADLVVTTDDEAEARMVLAARTLAYPALERLGATLLDDVAVPPGRLVALLDGIERIGARHGVTIGTFGHAGEGDVHPTIVYDHHSDAALESACAAFDAIVALALGGTITGEHGVGILKRAALAGELGPAASLHRAVKHALNPSGLLNPGKAVIV